MKRILFVDDEPHVLEGLKRMLHPYRKDWDMRFVPSAADALEALSAEGFDVIVSDVRMPVMDGIQLLDRVQRQFPRMIRVVLSGYFERDAALRAAGAAHQYLAKPCEPGKLYDTVNSLCRSTAILNSEAARGVVSAIGSLPSPPQTYAALKQALQRPEVSLSEVGRIIEQDVGMTAKVLQLVNSPLFGLECEIANIELALGYIGLSTLRELVLSIEVFQAFEPEQRVEGFSLDEFQSHCRLAARIAPHLPAEADVVPVAVIASLLHDVGKLVLAARLPGPFRLVLRKALEEGRPMYAVEEEVIGSSHADVGAYLMSLWGLPKVIVDAIWNHHRPSAAPPPARQLDVLAVTHIANALAADIETRVAPDEPPAGLWDLEYLERWGMKAQVPAWRRMALEIASPVGA